MRLNPDCIRDILLFVESNTDYEKECVSLDELLSELPYNKNTLSYHISKMDSAELFEEVYYSGDGIDLISSLSWIGHTYLDNIRDDSVWIKTKSALGKLSSVGLPILIQKAADIATTSLFNS
ncbi:DUF2513 domain-containing protein [Clostridium perfringens]|nr:DUF2513 domain-containing protein [Clostridium perfringens]MDM0759071.1 DUF2513 domain-containing protein [Clostridium perfringens]